MDTKIHPLSPIYRPRGAAEPITQYVNRVLGSIPATSGSTNQLKSLIYRAPNITNVYIQRYYGMYNYAVLGLKS